MKTSPYVSEERLTCFHAQNPFISDSILKYMYVRILYGGWMMDPFMTDITA